MGGSLPPAVAADDVRQAWLLRPDLAKDQVGPLATVVGGMGAFPASPLDQILIQLLHYPLFPPACPGNAPGLQKLFASSFAHGGIPPGLPASLALSIRLAWDGRKTRLKEELRSITY